MADKATLLVQIATLFADNNSGDISPADIRTALSDMVTADLNLDELTEQLAIAIIGAKALKLAPQSTDPSTAEGALFYDQVAKSIAYYNDTVKINLPAPEPLAIGQLRNGATQATLAITTTPIPFNGFGNDVFNLNTNITPIISGNGYRATFASMAGYDGYYDFNGTVSISSTGNVIVIFEFYKNGIATGLFSVIDLINNNINAGSASVSAFDRNGTVPTDEYEIYVYTSAGTSTITTGSFGFNMKRLGSV